MKQTNRREFLKRCGAGGMLLANVPLVNASENFGGFINNDDGGWIDAHVHLWTPDVDRYPLASGYSVADMQPKSFTCEELFSHTKPVGVKRIVLIQMSFYNFDNSFMTDMIREYPGVFSGVGIVDFESESLEPQLRSLRSRGVRGIRIHSKPETVATWTTSGGMANLWRLCRELKLAVCPLINPQDIRIIDTLCSRHPETRVVIDHFARIGLSGEIDWNRVDELCRLARFPTVHVKTSAFYALGRKQPPYHDLLPMMRRLLDSYGPERLMWASDCPFQVQGAHDYESSLALIRDADSDLLSPSDKEWLLRKTAEKLFFIP